MPKFHLQEDIREFIELLNAHDVHYVIVGGYAFSYHALPRYTGDIDFFVEASAENATRLVEVIQGFGFGDADITADDFNRADSVVQFGFPPNRIDLLTSISGVNFSEAWESRVEDAIDGIKMIFISKPLLLRNKQATAREKDAGDISWLEREKD